MPLRTLQREKVAALSLCSSFREVLHLQLLRARLKESRTHGSRTQARKQKDLLSFTAPQFNLISNKNDLVSLPAARGSCIAGDADTSPTASREPPKLANSLRGTPPRSPLPGGEGWLFQYLPLLGRWLNEAKPDEVEERQCQGRSKRERLGAFLGHFLPRSKKCHKKRYTERAQRSCAV